MQISPCDGQSAHAVRRLGEGAAAISAIIFLTMALPNGT
jgi:hypothetical protein